MINNCKNLTKVLGAFMLLLCLNLVPGFGEGTSSSPYEISTCLELQNVNNDISAYYILTQDVDCSDTVNWNNGAGFEPIGSSTNTFSGSFDGQNFTISDLFINRSSEERVGLFGSVFNSVNSRVVISNVGLEDVEVYGNKYVGGLVGRGDSATLTNNSATGSVNGNKYVGGLVGFVYSSTLTNNSATGSVNGDYDVGGLVGYGRSSTLTNNYATGSVNGNSYTGGLVGYGPSSTFTNNYATGSVNGNHLFIGGLVGWGNSATFTNNYATGSVSGNWYVGGLIGNGHLATLTNNYATGSANGNSHTGGLVGGGSCSVTQSYYDTETTGQTSSSCGVGKTTTELQTPEDASGIYSSWNSDIWNFGSSAEYPIFNLQNDNNQQPSYSISLKEEDDTGTKGDGITTQREDLTFSGVSIPGSTVRIFYKNNDGKWVASGLTPRNANTIADENGNWEIDVSLSEAAAQNVRRVGIRTTPQTDGTITNPYGSDSNPSTMDLTIQQPLVTYSISLNEEDDTGTKGDGITTQREDLTFSGVSIPGSTVRIFYKNNDGKWVASGLTPRNANTIADENGNWEIDVSLSEAAAQNVRRVGIRTTQTDGTITDPYGSDSNPSTMDLTIQQPFVTYSISLNEEDDTGTKGDGITEQREDLTFSGTSIPNSVVRIFYKNSDGKWTASGLTPKNANAITDENGNWEIDVSLSEAAAQNVRRVGIRTTQTDGTITDPYGSDSNPSTMDLTIS